MKTISEIDTDGDGALTPPRSACISRSGPRRVPAVVPQVVDRAVVVLRVVAGRWGGVHQAVALAVAVLPGVQDVRGIEAVCMPPIARLIDLQKHYDLGPVVVKALAA